MEICKASTLRLIALNKHSITDIMYIEMEMLSAIKMYIGPLYETLFYLFHTSSFILVLLSYLVCPIIFVLTLLS